MAASHVAIVNHDPVLLRLLEQVLTTQGYKTSVLPQGSAAYEAIKKEKPDLIMMDTLIEGRDTARVLFQILRLDEETIKIPVLLCGADDDFARQATSLEHHSGVELLNKPYDSAALFDKLRGMLEPAV